MSKRAKLIPHGHISVLIPIILIDHNPRKENLTTYNSQKLKMRHNDILLRQNNIESNSIGISVRVYIQLCNIYVNNAK